MVKSILGPMPRFNTIGYAEKCNLERAMKKPLSGYLGGVREAGYWTTKLSYDWEEMFAVRHAVPCNSATSGLLAACMAARIVPGSTVWVTAYSMSATAACAAVLGANVLYLDVDDETFTIEPNMDCSVFPDALIVTNLFGHAAYLLKLREWCDLNGVVMIEDNAQAPFATDDGYYAGTIGHVGVFSLNVHKHIQCGEGGVIVTNDDRIADDLHAVINHGELAGRLVGLNLRMTEVTASIACAQLKKGPDIVGTRRRLAEKISNIFSQIGFVTPPITRPGCDHSFYIWAGKCTNGLRNDFTRALRARGVPIRDGYVEPLHRLFNTRQSLPVVERLEDHELITYEVCAWDPTVAHLERMRDIILDEAKRIEKVSS